MSADSSDSSGLDALIRPHVRGLHGYVPGEQPKVQGLIKLNTNENPYPPSDRVLEAVRGAVDGRLRLYPNPAAQPLREALASLHGCGPENIVIGNGSDDLLALATRAFAEPLGEAEATSRNTVQYFTPSYSLYSVLTEIHHAARREVPLAADYGMPADLAAAGWDFDAALSFITTPNAPSGRGYSTAELEAVCRQHHGVLVLDEAYVDFAEENAMELALKYPHVLVSRTFSKAYSLCFQRIGYFVGHPRLIAAFDKIRDSYNVNGLGQVAAVATLDDIEYYRANFKKIIDLRRWTSEELEKLGFNVLPSQTNFILAKPPAPAAAEWLARLREAKLLVRWFDKPGIRDYLRVTIGNEAEMREFVRVCGVIARC